MTACSTARVGTWGAVFVVSLLRASSLSAQTPTPELTRCAPAPLGDPFAAAMWNGWGADSGNTRYQPAASAGLSAADVPKLGLRWALGFPPGAFVASQPTVVGGRIYLGTGGPGAVYSLDAMSGCAHWMFRTDQIVRTSITIGRVNRAAASTHAAFFGDLGANVYAIDADTGTLLWRARVDRHPQARIMGSPTLHDGRLYVPVSSLEEAAASSSTYECCTFRGSIVAYDAATGDELWRTYTIDEQPVPTKLNAKGTQMWGPAGGAVWNSPTVDRKRGLLYVAVGDGYTFPASPNTDSVMALDLATGKRRWVKQLTAHDSWISGCADSRPTNPSANCPSGDQLGPDFDFAQSPVLRDLPNGRSVIAIGQKSGIGWALDPDAQGNILWKSEIGVGSIRGGMLFGSAADEQQAYFALSDIPHGAEKAGGLAAVNLSTGQRAWYVRPPAIPCASATDTRCIQGQSAAVTAIPGVVFSGATNGIMRAYSTVDGKILWSHDTAREYDTLNGLKAKGGYLDGPGPTVVNGVVYMISGYAQLRGGIQGNVLLTFTPQ